MSTAEIEKRLIAIEQEVASLKAQRPPADRRLPIHSLEAIHGTFENDEAFQEAARLGRKWRRSHHLNGNKTKAKRK